MNIWRTLLTIALLTFCNVSTPMEFEFGEEESPRVRSTEKDEVDVERKVSCARASSQTWETFRLKFGARIHSVSWSPDSALFALGCGSHGLGLVDTAALSKMVIFHGRTHKVAFSHDGCQIVGGKSLKSGKHEFVIYKPTKTFRDIMLESDVTTPVPEFSFSQPSRATVLRYSPDDSTVVAGCKNGSFLTWDVATKSCRDEVHIHDKSIRALDFINHQSLYCHQGSSLLLYDMRTKGQNKRVERTSTITALAASVTSVYFAIGARDGSMALVDQRKDSEDVWGYTGSSEITSLGLIPGEQAFAYGRKNGFTGILFDAQKSVRHLHKSGCISDVSISADGQCVAFVAYNGVITLSGQPAVVSKWYKQFSSQALEKESEQ